MAKLRMLVVEDEPRSLHFVTELLRSAGYEVRGTTSPHSAIPLAEEFLPDLLLEEEAMPGMYGCQLAEERWGNAKTATISCLFLTECRTADGSAVAKAGEALGYLPKPISIPSLLWTIQSLFQNGKRSECAPEASPRGARSV